jgi:hypothetical protein
VYFIVVHERSITKCDLKNNIIKTILPRRPIFILQVVTVREPTDEEAAAGGPIEDTPVLDMPNIQKIH